MPFARNQLPASTTEHGALLRDYGLALCVQLQLLPRIYKTSEPSPGQPLSAKQPRLLVPTRSILIHLLKISSSSKMKTTHLTSLTASFNPFARHAKTPRLFLSLLPPSARATVKVTVKQLPRSNTDPSTLEIGFKDGKVLKYSFHDPVAGQKEEGTKLKDVVEQVERHSRGLKRKEDLAG